MATASEVLRTLESLGSEQVRKIYRRHGAPDPLYGVKFADLDKLVAAHLNNHALALKLWASGNADARVLAVRIADPTQLDRATLERWISGTRYPGLLDYIAGLTVSTPHARECARDWTASPDEWLARTGWTLVGRLALGEGDELPDATFEPFLKVIERTIHGAPNRARQGMNQALIAIGSRNDALAATAIAAAKRIGHVEIDHGDTSCKTPDAASYIAKVRAHASRKSAKPASKPVASKTSAKPASKTSAKTASKTSAKPAKSPSKTTSNPAAKTRSRSA